MLEVFFCVTNIRWIINQSRRAAFKKSSVDLFLVTSGQHKTEMREFMRVCRKRGVQRIRLFGKPKAICGKSVRCLPVKLTGLESQFHTILGRRHKSES